MLALQDASKIYDEALIRGHAPKAQFQIRQVLHNLRSTSTIKKLIACAPSISRVIQQFDNSSIILMPESSFSDHITRKFLNSL